MKILSQNKTALLIGDISKIELPSDVDVYCSYGVLQLFQKVSRFVPETENRNWLHIPLDIINSLNQNINNVPQSSDEKFNAIEPILCDDYFLFPVSGNGEINIILVSKTNTIDSISSATLECLIKTFNIFKENNQIFSDNHNKFLQTVAENKGSVFDFTKSILDLLAKEIPNSSVGYYTEEHGNLYRRIIVGDISKFDFIPHIVRDIQKSEWDNCINKGYNFVSTNKLSLEIQFLADPPDLYFVQKGLKSESNDNYISILLPGNCDLSKIHFLKTITKMTSNLSEKQFLNSILVLEYYMKNMSYDNPKMNLFVLLEKLFILLNKQLRISRLLYLQQNKTIEIVFTSTGEYVANENSDLRLTSDIINTLKKEKKCLFDLNRNENKYQTLSNSADANMPAEWIYNVNHIEGEESYLAIGTTKNIGNLSIYSKFIDDAVEGFKKCHKNLSMQSELKISKHYNKTLKSKLNLMNELSSGYFNQIFSKMTVILGKIEQIKRRISNSNTNELLNELTKYISTIETNADMVTEYFTALRSIITNEDGSQQRTIKSAKIMREIPNILDGYLHQTYINKNISIRLDNLTQMKSGFLISATEIFGAVIPILLSIINEAKQDGTIAIEAKRELEAAYIKISFHKSLLGTDDITALTLTPFTEYGIQADELGMFSTGNLLISNYESGNDMLSVKIRLKQELSINHENNKEELVRV